MRIGSLVPRDKLAIGVGRGTSLWPVKRVKWLRMYVVMVSKETCNFEGGPGSPGKRVCTRHTGPVQYAVGGGERVFY